MASEALPADQATDGIVEEKKDANNIKDTNGENVSQPMEIEGKDEEVTLKVESSTDTEKVLTESEEKPEAKSNSAVEMRKKDEDIDKASGSDDLVGHGVEEVDDFKKEAEISVPSELATQVTAEELKNLPDISDTLVPPNEEVEKSSKDFEASSAQELESEASKDHTVSEPVTEKVKGEEVTELSTIPSSISEAEDKQKELPMVYTAKEPADEVTTEELKNLPDASNAPVPPSEEAEKPDKDFAASSIQESGSEASKEQAASEPATKNLNGEEVTLSSTIPSSISEAEDKQKELPTVYKAKEPADEVTTEELKNLPDASNAPVPPSEEAEKPDKDFAASSIQESGSEASKEQAASEPATKNLNGEEVTLPSTIPSSISEAEDKQKELPMVYTAKEPADEVTTEELKNLPDVSNTPVPPSEEAEKPSKDFEASSVQESGSEASKEQATSEPATKKLNGEEVTLSSTIPSSISEAEDKQKELPTVYKAKEPADEVTTEELKNLPDASNAPVPPSEEAEKHDKDFEASSIQESGSEASKEQATSEPATKKLNGEEVNLPSTIPSSISEAEDKQKELPMVYTGKEPADEVTTEELKNLPDVSNTPVPPSEEAEKPSKDFEASSVQESGSEASKEQATSKPATKKLNGEEVTLPSTIPSSISEAEDKQKELPMVYKAKEPADEVTTEELKNLPDASNAPVPPSEEAEKPDKDFEASSIQESGSEASKEQATSEPATKKLNGEEVTLPSTIPSSISEAEDKQKELPMVYTGKEPADEVTTEELKNLLDVSNTPVPPSEEVEKPSKDFESSSVQESGSEASKEQATSEPATKKLNGEEVTLPSTIPSSISEAEDKQKELPMVYKAKEPADEVTTEELKNLPNASNAPVPPSEEAEKPDKDFEASSIQESGSEASKEQAASEPATEKVNGKEVTESSSTIPSSILQAVDKQKELPMVYTAKELADKVTTEEIKNLLDVSNTPVPPSEEVEKTHKDFEASSIQESESEVSKKQAVSEPVTQKVKGEEATEPSTIPSSISEEEDKQRELPVASTAKEPASTGTETLVIGEGAKASQDENKKVEETVVPENLDAVVTAVAKLQEAGKGAVALETIDAREETDAGLNADGVIEISAKEETGSSKVEEVVKGVAVDAGKPDASAAIGLVEDADASSVIKTTEDSMKPEGKVEEQKQENIIEAEEPNLSGKSKNDAASEIIEITYEGEKVTGSTEKVEEEKNENLEVFEANLMEPSKDLYAATGVSDVSSDERKVFEGNDMVEDKDENLEGKEEITKVPDAASIIVEPSSQEEKASESAAVFGEAKDEGLKDEKISAVEISKDFDAASEVAEFSSQEKVSKSPEFVAEEKEESSESEKTTLVETFKGFDAAVGIAQVSTKDEKSSVAAEMVEEKDGSLEGERSTSVETSRDLNVAAADISGVSSREEKTSGGGTGMVQEKKDEGDKCPESTETINEKKNEVSESPRKTLGETFKEHDLEEKNVIAASAAERIGDSEEVAKDEELAKDVEETGKRDDGGSLVEPPKDVDITKQDKEAPKQVVAKSSERHSNNIISKLKHSIVKAKRAILGKSPNSKSMSAGTKDDIKVK